MSEQTYEKKEKAEGIWNGEQVRFSRVWRGHRFTDEEVDLLLAGQEIPVRGLVSARTGNRYGVHGRLTQQSFVNESGERISFFGFEQMGYLPSEGIPDVLLGHTFTDEEKAALESGDSVYVQGFVSARTGAQFDALITYAAKDGETIKQICFDFGRKD